MEIDDEGWDFEGTEMIEESEGAPTSFRPLIYGPSIEDLSNPNALSVQEA